MIKIFAPITSFIALHCLLCATACAGGAAASDLQSFPAESLLSLTSDSGQLSISVRSAPDQPPTRGNVSLELSISDAITGEAQSGLELKAVPWMPAMGHGTSIQPTISEVSPGTYQLRNLVLFMPGTWQIRTELAGLAIDHVTPTFEIR